MNVWAIVLVVIVVVIIGAIEVWILKKGVPTALPWSPPFPFLAPLSSLSV